jgi:hypothetical protein
LLNFIAEVKKQAIRLARQARESAGHESVARGLTAMTKRKELTVLSVENWNEIPRNFTGKVFVAKTSRYEWYVNGQLHRADGPAREYFDGSKS